MVQTPDQGQENAIVNRALTKVPRPHITGAVLGKDIKLGTLQLNAIDDNNVVWVCTDIEGWWNLPDVEVQDLDKGWGDGSYNSKGRYRSRILTLEGVILPPDASKITVARDTLVRAIDLIRTTAWLVVNEADYTKAVKVRISGKPRIDNVNARGRIQFSIGLVAVDPIKYEWFGDSLATDYAETPPKNATGTQDGYVTINNKGNYPVGAVYEIEGPIVSGGATIFNETNGNLLTIIDSTRGKMYRYISAKSMANGVATLTVTTKHGLSVGDEIEVNLPESLTITNVEVASSVATFTTGTTHNFAIGDVFAVSNVHANLNNVELIVTATPTHNTYRASTTSGNITSVGVTGTVVNITNRKLNGTSIVESLVNNFAFTYTTIYNDSIPNVAQTFANSNPTVFRDADILEIDTSNREVAFNGDALQKRGMLDAVVDWVTLDEGNNLIQFDDSGAPTSWIYRYRTVANSSAGTDTITLYTTNVHGYSTSDSVTISNVSSNVNTDLSKPIVTYASSANVVTARVNSHGYTSGNHVVVSGIDNSVDGLYAVTNVNANFISFTTTASGDSYTTNAPEGATSRIVSKVVSYSRTGDVVTAIANAHGFYTNDYVYFTGLSNVVDGLHIVTNVDANTLTYVTRSTGNVASTNTANGYAAIRYQLTDEDEYKIVITKRPHTTNVNAVGIGAIASTDNVGEIGIYSITTNGSSNLVTLTTNGEHGFQPNENVQVISEDTSSSAVNRYAVATGSPVRINDWERASNGRVTLNSANVFNYVSFSANNYVTVSNVDSSVDGTYKLVSASLASNVYTVTFDTSNTNSVSTTVVDNAYMKRLHKVIYFTRNNGSSVNSATTGNVVYVAFDSSHGLVNGESLALYGLSSSIDGVRQITNVNATVVRYVVDSNALRESRASTNVRRTAITGVVGSVVSGASTVTTATSHNFVVGQSVTRTAGVAYAGGTIASIVSPTEFTVTGTFGATGSVTLTIGTNIVTVVTSTNHGFNVGDSIYVVGAGAVGDLDGQWVMYSNINATAFTYVSGATTDANITTTTRIHRSLVDTYSEEVYPIVSKTNTTFTYFHPNVTILNGTGTATAGNTTITGTTTNSEFYVGRIVERNVGAAMANSFITSVVNATAFTVNTAPTGSGSITYSLAGSSNLVLANTAGEVVRNSDGTMRVYFKSGWIG
jgi:hypothetical protein